MRKLEEMNKIENKKTKLHIGCGTVYLEGYTNIHPAPDYGLCNLSEEGKKVREINKTTVDNYYKSGFNERPTHTFADIKATLLDLPIYYKEGSVDEICMFHVLEHIPLYDLDKSMKAISSLLKTGGYFRVAVPDFDAIVLEYAEKLKAGISEEDKEWYYRYVHGTQKDKWSHHYCGYNDYRLIQLCKKYNLEFKENLPNQNFYPAIHMLFYKM